MTRSGSKAALITPRSDFRVTPVNEHGRTGPAVHRVPNRKSPDLFDRLIGSPNQGGWDRDSQ